MKKVDATLCASDEKDEITHTLSQLTTLIGTKCGLKPKRITKIQETIQANAAVKHPHVRAPFSLCVCVCVCVRPFSSLFFVPTDQRTCVVPFVFDSLALPLSFFLCPVLTGGDQSTVSLGDLALGQNPQTAVLACTVIYTVPVRSAVPLVYVCMDAKGHFFALTIYGLEENKFPLSHSKNKALQASQPTPPPLPPSHAHPLSCSLSLALSHFL